MLGVTIENSGNVAVLCCSGRIVAGEEAWTLYNTVISLKNKRVVVLDLTRVSGVDARGLGVLVFLEQWACGAGVKLQLIPSKPVQELLDLTGLHSLFDIRSSESVPPASDFLVDPREDSTPGIAADD
ncbi:MAG TPA: STAS domain-containing protein [Terriglobales bacterium]|nr:STAS domain-containing protein [Terriglobales bacterium]